MINTLNIRGYINYLYLQRNGSNAPNDLLDKWTKLNNNEINTNLKTLYESWQLNFSESNQYENNYLQNIANSVQQNINYSNQQLQSENSNYNYPPKKNNIFPIVALVIALGLIAGLGVWWFNNNKNNSNSDVIATNKQPQQINTIDVVTPKTTNTITVESTPTFTTPSENNTNQNNQAATAQTTNANTAVSLDEEINATDTRNISNIKSLLAAEENNNFDNIYSYFSTNMEQYWDIAYPTREELQKRYQNSFDKTKSRKHSNLNIQKLENNKYLVTGNMEYYSIKSSEIKNAPLHTIFNVDDNGKIIYENNK